MGRGILRIPASAGMGGSNYPRYLYMKQDKESARIRFLTEHDEVFFAEFHDIADPPFRDLCVKAEFGQVCRRCDKGHKPRMLFLAWVFTYTHDYIDKADAEKAGTPKVIKLRSGRKVYRVNVDEAQLICFSAAHKGVIQRATEKYGTLLDREYELVRAGEPNDTRTQYLLEPDDREEMPDELVDLVAGLPDLERVAADDLDDEEEEEKPRRRRSRRVVEDEEEEEEEDEEEEEEKPRRKTTRPSRPKRRPRDKEEEEEEEEEDPEDPLF